MTPRRSSVGALLGSLARGAAERAAEGALAGVKREFAPDGAAAALKTLALCLEHAEGEEKEALVGELRELVEKHGG